MIVSQQGANQVNATRDATRHAEVVAIDRLLTDGISSDHLRLPQDVDPGDTKDTHKNYRVSCKRNADVEDSILEGKRKQWQDRWVNEPSHPSHWTNSFGWRNNFNSDYITLDGDEEEEFKVISRDLRSKDIFRHCQLYVTCEVSQPI